MTAVICDTSPIRALAWIGHLQLLEQLFETVIVPPAVVNELVAARRPKAQVVVSQFPFIHVASPKNNAEVAQLLDTLDRGKAEAIVLAKELKAVLIVDDAAAREEAVRHKIAIMGTLRLLLLGKQRNFLTEIAPLLDQLQTELGFFIDDKLRLHILRDAGEATA